jgi:hypothetical protein
VLLIVFGVPILTVGCGGDNGTAQAADTATDTEATAEAIRATERERLQALVLGDVEAAAKFHADDFQLRLVGTHLTDRSARLRQGCGDSIPIEDPTCDWFRG